MEGDIEGVMIRPEGNNPDEEAEREKWYRLPLYLPIVSTVGVLHDNESRSGSPTMILTCCYRCYRDAWSSNHSLSRTEAKRRYISTLIETMHKYASTTPEARELVAELEFVWDQVKANSAASSASSPGQRVGVPGFPRQQQEISYASISPEMQKQTEKDPSGLRLLRPVSDGDEEEIEEGDTFEEARSGLSDEEGIEAHSRGYPRARDLEVRNRKWRKRVEQALIRMTAEVAALREQLESKRILDDRPRNGMWAWLVWITWSTIEHVVIDAVILLLLYVWLRGRYDQRLALSLRMLSRKVAERTQRLRLPWRLNIKANG